MAIWGANGLTGGTSGDLDNIPVSELSDGDRAVAITGSGVYHYIFDTGSGAEESSPDVIEPDDATGDERWILQNIDRIDGYKTETQPGQEKRVIPLTNDDGYLDQSWTIPIYGVRWDSVNDSMEAGFILGDSFVAADYNSFPIQEKMGRGLLTSDGRWTKLDPNDSSLLLDGSDATLDGSEGQVMVWIPKHYQLVLTDGDYKYFLISEWPFSFKSVNAWVPPAFQDKSGFYVGAFQGVAASDSTDADVYSAVIDTSDYSMDYPNPFTDRTRSEFRSQCSNTGNVFCQWSYGMYEVLRILFITEYKTWNSQDVLPGHTERSSWDYSDATPAGETVDLGDSSGSIYNDDDLCIANSYRGIENPFGNVWQWVDGINIDTDDNQRVWVAFDPDKFADDTTTDYIDTGIAPEFDDDDNYQKDIYGQEKYAPLWPTKVGDGADSDSYLTDYFWSITLGSGWRVVRIGGQLHRGSKAGFGALYSQNDSSGDADAIGARLGAYV